MTTTEPAALACWNCGGAIAVEDAFCRHCGKGQGKNLPWYYGHFGLILTVLALGPFTLFLVWKSPLLNKTAKVSYSLVILLFSWYAAVKFYEFWRAIEAVLATGLQF